MPQSRQTVLRDRSSAKKALWQPRDGSFEAHLPRSWSLSSSASGSFFREQPARQPLRPPSSDAMYRRNPALNAGRITSEVVGAHTGFKPLPRQRPVSSVNIMLRNAAVREGHVSSEPIGMHTGTPPRRTADPRERTQLPQSRTGRPSTAPIWTTTARTSDAIGTHPPEPEPDMNDAAVMHFEAQFAHRFGDHGSVGSVLSRGKITEAAAEFQRRWIARAEELSRTAPEAVDESASRSTRTNGQQMERMDFDAVYSNLHTHKDTESALGHNFVPVVDPRRIPTRPKNLPYGSAHHIQTRRGPRAPLPTRSFMLIGTGPGRSFDF